MHLSPPLPPGGSTWQPSWTSVACTTQSPATRSWQWPGTWNSLRGEPCRPPGTVPSLQTSLCPGRLSASASLSSWAASPSPGWPACPGLGLHLRLHHGPGPNTETLPAPPQCPPSLLLTDHPPNSLSGATDPWAGKLLRGLLTYPQTPCTEEKPARRSKDFPKAMKPIPSTTSPAQ